MPSLDQPALEAVLADRGALLDGHFRLSSGRHSARFIQKFRVLEDPALVADAARRLIERAELAEAGITVVVSAAVGGIVLGYETARQLGARSIFVEKEGGVPTLRRGFTLSASDRVFVVEDVVTTGGSVREVLAIIGESTAELVGVGVIVRRGQVELGAPTFALLDLPIESYAPESCPLCERGAPITDPGSRRSGAA